MANIDIEATLKKLSLEEKIALLSGTDFWHTASLRQSWHIPAIRMSDGPNGIRGTKVFNGVPAACFPCGTALGTTFNQDLLQKAGALMGQEAIAKNASVILGPTVNMIRSPLGGRGFESLGEDPVLSGLSAAAIIRGIQSTGIQATIKHFVFNGQEHRRNGVQSIVTKRALREIYALPFQIAVCDSRPGVFMTAYNGVNGTFCCDNEKLFKDEWGREGLVMSDWCGLYSTVEGIKAGLDLEMPGPSLFRGYLLRFTEVLKFVKKSAAIPGIVKAGPEEKNDTPETAALFRRIRNESIVLLKNEGDLLPLNKDKEPLVIGPNARVATYCGNGSAALEPYYAVSPYEGIKEKLPCPLVYTVGAYKHKLLPLLGAQMQPHPTNGKPGMSWKLYNETPDVELRRPVKEIWLTNTNIDLNDYNHPASQDLWYADLDGILVVEDGTYEFGLAVCGTAKLYVDEQLAERGQAVLHRGKEYHINVQFASAPSYTLKVDSAMLDSGALRVGCCKLLDAQAEIKKAIELSKSHDQVITCGGLNGDWEQESNDRENMKLPGTLDKLISEVTIANPRTVVAWYGGNETGNYIANVLFGDYNPSGKLPVTFPMRLQDVPSFLDFRTEAGRTLYAEDVYLGYRYYELADLEPMHPVKINRPVKELKGFAKVELDPGECKVLTISVAGKYAASYFDEERNQWCVEAGGYRVIISDSSSLTDGKVVTGSFAISDTYWWSGL
ncbi:beta-glucosidase precursor [Aspergillus filifer]